LLNLNKIRRRIRQQRRNLTKYQRQKYNNLIHKNLLQHKLFIKSKHIAIYLANDGEVELNSLLNYIWQYKKCYLPYIKSTKLYNRKLWFLPYSQQTKLYKNRYGILEPKNLSKKRNLWSLDLILVPLVAFDNNNKRLGMGAGYYDRSFAYLLNRKYWCKPKLLGIAYELQKVDNLPYRSWDVPLSGIVTEKKCYN
jgi:5-formyltetrahydrofolate cyclo-ligase